MIVASYETAETLMFGHACQAQCVSKWNTCYLGDSHIYIYTATLELNFISKDEVQTIASHAVYLYCSTVIGSNTNSSIMAQTQQQHWR